MTTITPLRPNSQRAMPRCGAPPVCRAERKEVSIHSEQSLYTPNQGIYHSIAALKMFSGTFLKTKGHTGLSVDTLSCNHVHALVCSLRGYTGMNLGLRHIPSSWSSSVFNAWYP